MKSSPGMPKRSAGILMYREREGALEVFLVHAGGPFFARKDNGAWSVPKGEYADGADPFTTAQREFTEETGFPPPEGDYRPLAPITQRSGKIVTCWAAAGDCDASAFVCRSTFRMEWPPRSGRMEEFPEVDRAGWFPLPIAREKVNPAQVPLLDELAAVVR